MAARIRDYEQEKILWLILSGTLSRDDIAQCAVEAKRRVQRHGKISMLVELENFDGWDASAVTADIQFHVENPEAFDRVAVVGEKTWEQMLLFFSPLMRAEARHFPSSKLDEALQWMEGSAG